MNDSGLTYPRAIFCRRSSPTATSDLVRQHVGLGEFSRSAKPGSQFVIKAQVDIMQENDAEQQNDQRAAQARMRSANAESSMGAAILDIAAALGLSSDYPVTRASWTPDL